ncbi:DUF5689 domain-containing protein [Flavobacterium sp. BFFFF1]|uniref:DUF5689 domain-containing protein n=1 Tax=Flavobacterium sp. BFFFF1 TaxID=2015557 RepID=UPI0025C45850|nr:DUF5689 domain-containing protein [Flavobacterium sp. BFFFF1]
MKLNIFKTVFMTALLTGVVAGCANDDEYGTPNLDCPETSLSANKTVQEIIATVPAEVLPDQPYTDDDIIEAYVTSSDEGGNFYKSISFQTHPTNGSAPVGFSVPVDAGGTFVNYPTGTKVFIKLKGQYRDIYNESMRIGGLYELDPATDTNPAVYAVGRLSIFDYAKVLVRSCTRLGEEDLVRTMTIAEAKNDANLNTLIELDGVQFTTDVVGKTLYDATDDLGGATNHLLTDNVGNTIDFRTSSFANFAGDIAPGTSGKIRGVLTKFSGTYQFLARTKNDIKLTEPRFTIDLSSPIVGNALTFSGSFNETFESGVTTSPGNRTFPKYINDPVVGTRYWQTTTFSNNKYLQMTSFTSSTSTTLVNEDNRSLFFMPVDFTAASNFSFQSKAGFVTGPVLKVYYISASDYTPGGPVNNAALVDITSNFTISAGLATGYPANFTPSGNYAIPATLTGNGYFVFEYVGSGLTGNTTTMQIDNVTVN